MSAAAARSDGWERRHYADGAFLRSRNHSKGRRGVQVLGGTLHVDMEVGGLRPVGRLTPRGAGKGASAANPPARLRRARPIGALVDHLLLADDR